MSNSIAFDSTLNPLEEARLLKKYQDFARQIAKKVHFSLNEVEALIIMYYKIQKNGDYDPEGITKEEFRDVLHKALDMTDDRIMNIVVTALDTKARDYIGRETWINALSLLLRGTLEEKLQFCFSVYDYRGAGVLGKEAIFNILKYSLLSSAGESDAEESVRDLVDVILKKLDVDRDGKISFNDYKTAVLKDPGWLEFLGPCLPDRSAISTFLNTMTRQLKRTF
ncbi:unnamed protein product [Phaedon cochleariae]|uniref:EF-hand domain-containing protein n=1 Tax=Phaedon cochleariae TaxID=80249 RepID=A0A9P0DW83_PHACE|nr:unnamed protein product [Phaedon cochleariae]